MLLGNSKEEMAGKVKKLYNVLITTFVHTLTSNANKQNNQRQEALNHVPECAKALLQGEEEHKSAF